ncbi:Rv1733c family protein [Gandjariella thermophila]|uniref:Rv1733c family protein n=1 Tax=Gandjariella thermophila TaxID=1931992 RepID=UPI001CEFA05F|nr:hypothetical protein [Gandjariella thermophila]
MKGSYGLLARFWRRVHPGRNPVARPWDRIEAAMLIGVVLAVLLAFPLAAVIGSSAYAGELAVAAHQRADRRPATATLLADAPPPVVTGEGQPVDTSAANVPARWTVNGVERHGNVAAHPGDRAGSTVPIWLTSSGDLAASPISSADAAMNGVLTGVFVWLAAVLLLTGLYWAGRWCLDRQRAAQWDREWALISGHWTRS